MRRSQVRRSKVGRSPLTANPDASLKAQSEGLDLLPSGLQEPKKPSESPQRLERAGQRSVWSTCTDPWWWFCSRMGGAGSDLPGSEDQNDRMC